MNIYSTLKDFIKKSIHYTDGDYNNKKTITFKIIVGFHPDTDISSIMDELNPIKLESLYTNSKYIEDNLNDFKKTKYLYNIQKKIDLYTYNDKFSVLKKLPIYNEICYLDCSNHILDLESNYEFPQNLQTLICNNNIMSNFNSIKLEQNSFFESKIFCSELILLPDIDEIDSINCKNNIDKIKYVLVKKIYNQQDENECIVSTQIDKFGTKYKKNPYIINKYSDYYLYEIDDEMKELIIDNLDNLNILDIDNINDYYNKTTEYYMKMSDVNPLNKDGPEYIYTKEEYELYKTNYSVNNIYAYDNFEKINDDDLLLKMRSLYINNIKKKKLIATLPTLPESLEYLDCSYCKLFKLPNIPHNLKYLDCKFNNLLKLPVLPDSLQVLNCSFNIINKLPVLPDNLCYINISYNYINHIDKLPSELIYFMCNVNKLSNLDNIYNCKKLISLNCSSNKINTLQLPDTIERLIIVKNNIDTIPVLPDTIKLLDISNNKMINEIKLFPLSIETFICNDTSIKELPKLTSNIKVIKCSNCNIEDFNKDVLVLDSTDFIFKVIPKYLNIICCSYCDYKINMKDYLQEMYILSKINNNNLDNNYPVCKNCRSFDNKNISITLIKTTERIYNGINLRYSNNPVVQKMKIRFDERKTISGKILKPIKYAYFKDYFSSE